ncbi:MAG: collagen-like protein [Dehalococcoidia bacterium]|nr:collagen-like protein [Dehalococcoidia bacterium]
MRRLSLLIALVAFSVACQGTAGPTGSAGPRGEPGPAPTEQELRALVDQAVAARQEQLRGGQGSAGPQGAQGPEGKQGSPGSPGPEGKQGAPGPSGPEGKQGLPGPQASAGPEGQSGSLAPKVVAAQASQAPSSIRMAFGLAWASVASVSLTLDRPSQVVVTGALDVSASNRESFQFEVGVGTTPDAPTVVNRFRSQTSTEDGIFPVSIPATVSLGAGSRTVYLLARYVSGTASALTVTNGRLNVLVVPD